MSGNRDEDLIDYEDEEVAGIGAVAVANGGTASGRAEVDGVEKKNFSGIHSTGFRCESPFQRNKNAF